MTHLTDEELFALPEDPAEAFVAGERRMRERLSEAISGLDQDDSTNDLTQAYMNNVIALASHFVIGEVARWQNAKPGHHDWMEYQRFKAEVDACTMGLRLRTVQREREYSVALDAATKQKLGHMLAQMRETVEKLDVSSAKKDRLRSRINALQQEIDRERTGYQAFGALMIEVCDDAGEAAKRLQPVVKFLERIGAAIGVAKRSEPSPAQLPPPLKRIEGPRKQADERSNSLDSVPF